MSQTATATEMVATVPELLELAGSKYWQQSYEVTGVTSVTLSIMAPKSIFRQPGAKHFQLVHRSQRDPLIHDPDASQRVLKEIKKVGLYPLNLTWILGFFRENLEHS